MSKNIKGKNLDININITQAGTFNADIFNAYEDFTLDGISIINRITELEINKQDLITEETDLSTGNININDNKILSTSGDLMINASIARIDANVVLVKDTIVCNGNTIVNTNLIVGGILNADLFPNLLAGDGVIIEDGSTDGVPARKSRISLDLKQQITASSTSVASCDAIIAYVENSIPSLEATAPLQYESGVISASFDNIPIIDSINLLSSGSIFNRFLLFQPLITQNTTLHTGFITTGGLQCSGLVQASAGFVQSGVNLLQQINTKQNIITASTDIVVNSIDINNLTGNSITITGSNGRIDCGLVSASNVATTGPVIAGLNIISNNGDVRANSGNVIGVKLLGDIYDNLEAGNGILLETGEDIPVGKTRISVNIPLQQEISASSTSVASCDAIINFVENAISSIPPIDIFDNLQAGDGILLETGGDIPVGKTRISVNIPLEQEITASSTSVASSNAIINYIASAIPSLQATAPLQYDDGIISASFDTIPTSGSINLLSSGSIYNQLELYQPLITEETNLELGAIIANGSIQTTGVVIATGNIIANGSNVIGEKLFGDIYTNLVAGQGIILENDTIAGVPAYKTRISATALFTSTQYAFQASGSVGDLVVGANDILPFNNTSTTATFVVPNLTDYENANNGYRVQVDGIYQFGFNVFQRDAIGQFRLGIYKNGAIQGMGGMTQSQTESLTCLVSCAIGDLITVKVVVGTNAPIFMGNTHTWFFGHLLEPKNNTVSVETDLTVANLNVSGTINGIKNINLISHRFMVNSVIIGNFNTYMPDFLLENHSSIIGDYINPSIATNGGDNNKGFICNFSGFYRVEYHINFNNFGFADRSCVEARIFKNNSAILHGNSYCYPRHQGFGRHGTCSGSACFECGIGDNIDIRCGLDKASNTGFGSNFMGVGGFGGSSLIITYLGTQ